MQGFMVYAWDQYYPDIASRQVKCITLDEEKAKALVNEIKAAGKFDRAAYIEVEIIE